MYPIELRLQYRADAVATAVEQGWYLPGLDIDVWLEAIGEHLRLGHVLRLFVAPTSLHDRRAAGLIVLRSPTPDTPVQIGVPLGAIELYRFPYQGAAELWLPSHGQLMPESGAKLWLSQQSTSDEPTYVWLPSNGLIRFEQLDEQTVADLIRNPIHRVSSQPRQWTAPPAAVSLPDRLVDILLLIQPTFEQVFARESHDIGGDESLLPKLNDDGTTDEQGIGQRASEGIKRLFQRLISGEKQSEREQQIEKLLELMKRDPDQALRFAIPMTGMQAFRGLTNSGSKLSSRLIDFSLSRLFGGGGQPADFWDLSATKRAQLNVAYREQANREVAAGRHRRAAYIYAHLLGDLAAAASILERGKHYNEAAVLYGEKLNRLYDQARCLALAGQASEAATIYERLREFELAAAVWEAAAEPERARESFEQAVSKRIIDREPRKAALLVKEKLQDPPRAEALLWQQWPRGIDPLECAELGFAWLAERLHHAAARERLDWVVEHAAKNQLVLAKLAAGLCKSYPDVGLREVAEDHCRVAVAKELQQADYKQVEPPLAILRLLGSTDSLLIRDSQRYQNADRLKQPKLLPPIDRASKNILLPLSSACLSGRYRYVAAQMLDGELLSFAIREGDLFILRSSGCLRDEPQSTAELIKGRPPTGNVQFTYCWRKLDTEVTIFLSFRDQRKAYESISLNSNQSGPSKWNLGQNAFPKESAGAFASDGTRYSLSPDRTTLSVTQQEVLETFDVSSLVSACMVQIESLQDDNHINGPMRTLNVACDRQWIAAIDRVLVTIVNGKPAKLALLDHSANCLVASMPHGARRVAVATDKSLSVIWLDQQGRIEVICRDDGYKHVAFLPGGYLVATTDTYLRIFRLFRRTHEVTQLLEERLLQSRDVVAILPLDTTHFALLYRNGLLERFRIMR